MFSNQVLAISHSQSDLPHPPQTTDIQSKAGCESCRRKWKKILLTSLAITLMMTIGVIVVIFMAKENSVRLAATARPTTTTTIVTTTTALVMTTTTRTIFMKARTNDISFVLASHRCYMRIYNTDTFTDKNCGAFVFRTINTILLSYSNGSLTIDFFQTHTNYQT
ncbi:unnamed protein product [Adineta ricciae]|uniref:Uncharacterized protein n=1 Tax=Adineta ricciae TaxID=249248 RepID=A0A815QC22_ADIRI|nr:unnamed protein product [Adineta ricciae]